MKNPMPAGRQEKIKYFLAAALLIFIIWVLVSELGGQSGSEQANALNAFAQCLSEKAVTMYGADWCPHCQNEKNAFG